ncbi:MAG TPA: TOBE domain-containing protein [Kiritimatiellia bacterium]|nr:TOBE domain-containing protein [Kiritimatiellia bacterium]HRZ13683.1 TOBE domain-containing protein [Kiritimatiellia bacterium]HSA19221.1 TOBE domain-containing protein [Kiritimatiellia bacterium]
MAGPEIIRLDARVVSVITNAVFRVELANGHGLVAYAARAEKARAEAVSPGDRVRVELSPCDMSRGRLVFREEENG